MEHGAYCLRLFQGQGRERSTLQPRPLILCCRTVRRPYLERRCSQRPKNRGTIQLVVFEVVALHDGCRLVGWRQGTGRKSPHPTLVHLNFWKSSNHSTSRSASLDGILAPTTPRHSHTRVRPPPPTQCPNHQRTRPASRPLEYGRTHVPAGVQRRYNSLIQRRKMKRHSKRSSGYERQRTGRRWHK